MMGRLSLAMVMGIVCLGACTDTPRSRPVPPEENFYPNLADVPPRVYPTTDPEERDEILENLETFQGEAQTTRLNAMQ